MVHWLLLILIYVEKKLKNVFIKDAISPTFIADSIAKHQSKTQIGAHDIFLGQVALGNWTNGWSFSQEFNVNSHR